MGRLGSGILLRLGLKQLQDFHRMRSFGVCEDQRALIAGLLDDRQVEVRAVRDFLAVRDLVPRTALGGLCGQVGAGHREAALVDVPLRLVVPDEKVAPLPAVIAPVHSCNYSVRWEGRTLFEVECVIR